jgi:uncharacterized protein YndB with AHSA1/START domain
MVGCRGHLGDSARGGRPPRGRQLPAVDAHGQGEVHTVFGEYREVRPPVRLAYTWTWEEGPGPAMEGSENTLVVIDFIDDGDGTLVKLTHSGFANEQLRDMHTHGWEAVLANLEARVFPA